MKKSRGCWSCRRPLKAYSPVRVVGYYRTRMQIEEGFRGTKSTHYGLDLACERWIEAERRTNLLLIAALTIFALWFVGLSLKGSATEWQIRVNSGQNNSPYSVIFLGRIACRYMSVELAGYLCRTRTGTADRLFQNLGGGLISGYTSGADPFFVIR